VKRRLIISIVITLTSALAGVAVSAAPAAADDTFSLRFYSFLSNQCLQPVNGSTAQGAAIVQMPCTGGAIQQWTGIPVGNNIFHFQNNVSHLCLDARGGATTGTPVQQWTCNRISNENWEIDEDVGPDDPDSYISRVSGTRSHCLDIPWAQPTVGLAMQIARCNGTAAQHWWPF
jgi:hypothetical protein